MSDSEKTRVQDEGPTIVERPVEFRMPLASPDLDHDDAPTLVQWRPMATSLALPGVHDRRRLRAQGTSPGVPLVPDPEDEPHDTSGPDAAVWHVNIPATPEPDAAEPTRTEIVCLDPRRLTSLHVITALAVAAAVFTVLALALSVSV